MLIFTWNSFVNMNPTGRSVFPYLCITIACGAISGFHATQSPMMARCLKTEKMEEKFSMVQWYQKGL